MNKLGFCYENDNGVEKDEKRTFEWYQKAAETGDGSAMYELGTFYEEGKVVEKNEEKAFEWYRKAVEAWYYEAAKTTNNNFEKANCYYNIGEVLRIHENITQSQEIINDYYTKALYNYVVASEEGNAEADSILGKMYRKGFGTKKDYVKAFESYERAARKSNKGENLFNLGKCYQYGVGVEINTKKAFLLYKRAAYEENNIIAYVYIGYCYQNGIGVRRSYKKAKKIFNSVLSDGDFIAKELANYYIGLSYYFGEGVGKSYEIAKLYLEKTRFGRYLLKVCYGDYSEAIFAAIGYYDINQAWVLQLHIDKSKAYRICEEIYFKQKSSLEHSLYALSFLEVISRTNRKLHISPKQAFKYRICLVEKDKTEEIRLGQYYYYGYGTKKNYEKAVVIFEDFYRKGNELGKIYLSLCYSEGKGVEKNLDIARNILENDLTPKQEKASFLMGLLLCGGYWKYKKDRKKGLQLMRTSITSSIEKRVYILLSAPRGDVYVEFCFDLFVSSLYFTYFYKCKIGTLLNLLKMGSRSVLLWFFKNPNSVKFSKKELYIMIRERQSDYDKIMKRLEDIDYNMKYLPDISERVNQIDDKINVILSNLETKIMHMKSECALENVKSDIEEKICHKFITEAMEIIRSSLNNVNTLSKEEDILQNMFGKYWELLDGYTRNSLVSARVLFSLSNKPEYYGLDYSGIVIAVTSALENELKLRFFDGYQEYLIKKYGNPTKEQWPKSMLKEKCGKIEKNDNFTIGSMPYIFGVYGEISQSERDILNDYLKKILNSNNKNYGIDAIVIGECGQKSIIARCEQVRRDYRNKAAHTKPIEKNLALKCCNTICDAIIAADEMEIIQGLLLDVVKLTSNYKNK